MLLATAALGAFALVDLLLETTLSGVTEPMLLGVSLGQRPVHDAVVVAVALAVLSTALFILGVAVVRAGGGRRGSKRLEEDRASVASLDSAKKLLDHKVELLLARVQELEERKAALLGGSVEGPEGEPPRGERLVVIPDTPFAERELGSERGPMGGPLP